MKRFLKVAVIFLALGWTVGCTPTVNPPTAPAMGYVDNYDQQFGQAIVAATNFYTTIQMDVNQGTYKPTDTELTILNAFGVALNVAKGAAQVYHNQPNAANLQVAQAKVGAVQAQQSALTAQIVGK